MYLHAVFLLLQIVDRMKRDPTEEIEILSRYGSIPNILKLREVLLEKEKVYIVTEYLAGGELFDRIFEQKYLKENEARDIMKTITEAVAALHEHGVSVDCVTLVYSARNGLRTLQKCSIWGE